MKKILVATLAVWTAGVMSLATAQTSTAAGPKEELHALVSRVQK
jgi:hypothetical protein